MECQALRTIKWKMAPVADDGGLLVHVVVWTRIGLVSIAGPASSAFAGVVGCIILIIATVTFMAPITAVDEPGDGGTPLKVLVAFEKDDLVFSVRSAEYQKKGMVTAENLQLVWWVQGRQVGLELFQFSQTAWTFWDVCGSVKLFCSGFLSGKTPTKCVPLILRHVPRIIAMAPSLHGHDGAGAAQMILVFDLYD